MNDLHSVQFVFYTVLCLRISFYLNKNRLSSIVLAVEGTAEYQNIVPQTIIRAISHFKLTGDSQCVAVITILLVQLWTQRR